MVEFKMKMNGKGQKSVLGMSLLVVAFVLILASFATIEPLKENLDDARDNTSLNCPGTTGFNQTDYDDDTDFEKLVRRPTCFVTGMTLVYFIGAFFIGVIVWVVANWRRI